MQKQINILLYKNLLLSDFCFIPESSLLQLVGLQKVLWSKRSLYYLDLFECIKALKLLTRSVLFLKRLHGSRLVIFVSSAQYFLLLQDFSKKYNLSYKLVIVYDKLRKHLEFDFTQFFLFLGFDSSNKHTITFYRQLFLRKIFLVMYINFNIDFNSSGHYKFYSDVSDFKKVVFLLLFINKII